MREVRCLKNKQGTIQKSNKRRGSWIDIYKEEMDRGRILMCRKEKNWGRMREIGTAIAQ